MENTLEHVSVDYRQFFSTVSPGLPVTISDVHSPGDQVWQGDLGIEIVSFDTGAFKVPEGYVEITDPKDADRQLVPESGQGSHHRLKTLENVRLFRPKEWGRNLSDLNGPLVVLLAPNEIVHEPGHDKPHGAVIVGCPMVILCTYQRNLTLEGLTVRAIE